MSKSVFIIDDDPIVLAIGKKLIERHARFEGVSTATNGEIALDELNRSLENSDNLPAFILLDLNMPVMDGWEFLESIRNKSTLESIPIFIFTSSINPVDKEKSLTYPNVKGYISKPLTLKILDEINFE